MVTFCLYSFILYTSNVDKIRLYYLINIIIVYILINDSRTIDKYVILYIYRLERQLYNCIMHCFNCYVATKNQVVLFILNYKFKSVLKRDEIFFSGTFIFDRYLFPVFYKRSNLKYISLQLIHFLA